MSCALCRGAPPLCDWCRARVVDANRRAVEDAAHEWAMRSSRPRTLRGWSDDRDRALAQATIECRGVADPAARVILARVWLTTAAATSAARARKPPVVRRPVPTQPPPATTWLWKRAGEPYRLPADAVSFHVYRHHASRWHAVIGADGAPLSVSLHLTCAAFARAVGVPGVYRLTPVDAHGVCVAVPPRPVRIA